MPDSMETSLNDWVGRKHAKLKRSTLDCGHANPGDVHYHYWCDRLSCSEECANAGHDCGQFKGKSSSEGEAVEPEAVVDPPTPRPLRLSPETYRALYGPPEPTGAPILAVTTPGDPWSDIVDTYQHIRDDQGSRRPFFIPAVEAEAARLEEAIRLELNAYPQRWTPLAPPAPPTDEPVEPDPDDAERIEMIEAPEDGDQHAWGGSADVRVMTEAEAVGWRQTQTLSLECSRSRPMCGGCDGGAIDGFTCMHGCHFTGDDAALLARRGRSRAARRRAEQAEASAPHVDAALQPDPDVPMATGGIVHRTGLTIVGEDIATPQDRPWWRRYLPGGTR